jgi:signal transduction histidine kinase
LKIDVPISDQADYPDNSSKRNFSDQIINNSRSMISIINRDYVYEKVNSTFCNAHNELIDNLLGMSVDEIWGKQVFGKLIKSKIDSCFDGNIVRYEAFFNIPKLGKRFFEVIFRPLQDEEGRISRVYAETFDINDIRLSRDSAIKKEAELKKIENCLPVGFLRCDCEGKILYANRIFAGIMLCNDESSLTGKNLQDFYTEKGLFRLHIIQLDVQGSKTFGNVTFRNTKGEEVICRVNAFASVDETGSGFQFNFTFEDSTREVMLENRLIQARKMETIGVLAGGIAHDFNNILLTISGYSEMLREDLPQGSDHAEKVGKIQNAVQKGRSIINQILTYSRQIEQEKVPVNISDVLRETIGFIQSSIPANVELKRRIEGRDAIVLADPTQLFRVFLNLMTNAIQAMEKSGGTLTMVMSVVEGNMLRHKLNKDILADEYVMISFSDTGEGMETTQIQRIFEPFFTTRNVGGGTGLGLSVIQGIITELDGEILVSSKKNEGSDFYVYLPLSKDYTDFLPDNHRRRILFIKGNKYESRILSLALRNKGHELIYISDYAGLNAALSEEKEKPDLVIYMADSKTVDQNNLANFLKKQKFFIPCIFISDMLPDLSEEILLNSGFVKQKLIKPVSLKEITGAINSSIGGI